MTAVLRPAVFLDRDGTLITERHYLADPEGVELVPDALEALRSLREAGYALVVVTNQSGIARGLYTLEEYRLVAARLERILAEGGVPVDGTWFCPHHPEVTGPCTCRKPSTGMHLAACAELGLDPGASWYVGDKVTDVLPSLVLGGRGVLVRTGYGRDLREAVPEGVVVVDDLGGAAARILDEDRRPRARGGRGPGAPGAVDPPGSPG